MAMLQDLNAMLEDSPGALETPPAVCSSDLLRIVFLILYLQITPMPSYILDLALNTKSFTVESIVN